MKKALLIPCYEPQTSVLTFLKNFKSDDFDYFLLVDDGSGSKYQSIFEAAKALTCFELLSYPKNKGKGGALKTGIAYLLEKDPDLGVIVTCDSDGQHAYEDVLKVRDTAKENPESLILGSRQFSGKDVPTRSKFGNGFSSLYFKMVSKKKCQDTQTGLRAIPANLFELALAIPGNRFDYEMNFLMEAVREADFLEVPISTLYEVVQKRPISHFRTFRDSYLIYRTPIWYILASLLSFGVDILIFTLLSSYVFTGNTEQQVFLSNLIARFTSGTFNFLMLNFVVFRTRGNLGGKAAKYTLLWGVNYGLSSMLTYLFSFLPMALTFVKVIFDTVIAILNYVINLTVVFVRKKKKARTPSKERIEAK